LAFTANADTAYISYELQFDADNSIVNSGTVYAPDFEASIPSVAANNLLHVVATPYCSNDVAGAEFTKSF